MSFLYLPIDRATSIVMIPVMQIYAYQDIFDKGTSGPLVGRE